MTSVGWMEMRIARIRVRYRAGRRSRQMVMGVVPGWKVHELSVHFFLELALEYPVDFGEGLPCLLVMVTVP